MYLRELLQSLENGPDKLLDRDQYEAYAKRVEFLEALMNEDRLAGPSSPMFRSNVVLKPSSPTSPSRPAASSSVSSSPAASPPSDIPRGPHLAPAAKVEAIASTDAEALVIAKQRHQRVARDELFDTPPAAVSGEKYDAILSKTFSGDVRSRRPAPSSSSSSAQTMEPHEMIREHREMQERMIDSMVDASQMLKAVVNDISSKLARENADIDDAAGILTKNLATTQATNAKMSIFKRQIWGNTWMTWLILLGVCVVFMLMFVFMKIVPKRNP